MDGQATTRQVERSNRFRGKPNLFSTQQLRRFGIFEAAFFGSLQFYCSRT